MSQELILTLYCGGYNPISPIDSRVYGDNLTRIVSRRKCRALLAVKLKANTPYRNGRSAVRHITSDLGLETEGESWGNLQRTYTDCQHPTLHTVA